MTASVIGLRKMDNFEHVLAMANKDERPQGIISIGLQREATKMILEFQLPDLPMLLFPMEVY